MGFLDRLVTDMIHDSTGLPVRRLVRMVGGKNLLMMGAGAALAGGAGAALGTSQAGAAQAPPPPPPPPAAGPPPPPPVPGSAAASGVPPPPPAAAPATPAGDEAEEPTAEVTCAIVRAMVAAALADGRMTPEEREIIYRRLGESGLGEEQVRQIHQDLVLPPTPEELAALAPNPEAREALYRFAALIVLADRETSDLERQWLDRLGLAFALDAGRRTALETEIFGPEGP